MDMRDIIDRYRQRLDARVAERDGGCFDISLEVGGLSVGCVRLGNIGGPHTAFQVYRDHRGETVAMDAAGELVPLPD